MTTQQAVLAVIGYHDVFDYPLIDEEIYRFLPKKSTHKSVINAARLFTKKKLINEKNGYFFINGREVIIKKRAQRQKYSEQKLKRAKLYANILKIIPTIKLVAITGALAMKNSTKDDDIDFLIITKKNSLWTTRFLANLALFFFKRNPKSKKQANLACLNMFLDESDLTIKVRNIYTAHELCQLKRLWDKDKTYEKFVNTNSWVAQFLPNWGTNGKLNRSTFVKTQNLKNSLFVENFLKNIQLNYMSSKITNEIIGDRQLFFHPQDNQSKILKLYSQNLKRLKIKTS